MTTRRGASTLLVTVAAATGAIAAALAGVAGNATTGDAPQWLPSMARYSAWWLAGSVVVVTCASVFGVWVQRRAEDVVGPAADRDSVAVRLVRDIARQLRAQDRFEQVHDPWPIPARLTSAPAELMDHWRVVRGRPGNDTPLPVDTDVPFIVDVYADIPSRRMVLLGPAGAGKTVAARRLAADLAELYRPGDPVPVMAHLSSWDVTGRGLREWLEQRIVDDHPHLAAHRGALRELFDAGRILPILDGLDEIHPQHRAPALLRINRELLAGQPLVLTSRPEEFISAVEQGDVVSGAAVLKLAELDADTAFGYLQSAAPPAVAERWAQVRAAADPAAPLVHVLRSPLYVAMAREVYGRSADTPGELLDARRYPDARAIERELMAGYVRRALAGMSERGIHDRAAQRWLRHLADWAGDGNGDLAWWDLPQRVPRALTTLTWAVVAGGLAGSFWMAWAAAFNPNSGRPVGGVLFAVVTGAVAACLFCPAATTTPRHAVRRRAGGPIAFVIVTSLALTAVAAHGGPIRAAGHVLELAASALVVSFFVSPSWAYPAVRMVAPRWSSWMRDSAKHQEARWISATAACGAALLVYGALLVDGWSTIHAAADVAVVVACALAVLSGAFAGAVATHELSGPSPAPRVHYRVLLWTVVGLGTPAVIWYAPVMPDVLGAVVNWLNTASGKRAAVTLVAAYLVIAGRHLAAVHAHTVRVPYRIAPATRRLAPAILPRLVAGAAVGFGSGWLANGLLGLVPSHVIVALGHTGAAEPIEVHDPRVMWLGAAIGAAIGVVIGLGEWLRSPADDAEILHPRAVLRADRFVTAIAASVPAVLAFAVVDQELWSGFSTLDVWQGWAQWAGNHDLPAPPNVRAFHVLSTLVVMSAPGMLFIGLPLAASALRKLAWPQYQIARLLLAVSGRIPWRLFRFLDQARDAGLLRQVGGVHQFRHARLVEFLRDADVD